METFLRQNVYVATYPGWFSARTSALSSPPASSASSFSVRHDVCTLYAVRSSVYTHGGLRVRPPAPPRDRDAKETRAAFKLAATKRINSPGSLDLLIRAGVAFLRGLDR